MSGVTITCSDVMTVYQMDQPSPLEREIDRMKERFETTERDYNAMKKWLAEIRKPKKAPKKRKK